MKRIQYLIIFFLVQHIAWSSGITVINNEILPVKQFTLNSQLPWKYHSGDNPEWASAEFDDSEWTFPYSPLMIKHEMADEHSWSGIGWFRTKIKASREVQNKNLGMVVKQICATEVYLDGKKVFSKGTVSPDKSLETCYATFGEPSIVPITLSDTASHVIAVRYSNHDYERFWKNAPSGFFIHIADYDQYVQSFLGHINTQISIKMLFTGIPLAFAVIHFLLFVFYPKERANLYYSIFSIGTALLSLSVLSAWMKTTVIEFLIHMWLFKLSLLIIFLFGVQFLYSIFYKRLPRQYWGFSGATVLLLIFSWYVGVGTIYFFGFVVLIEEIRVMVMAVIRKKPGAYIVLGGVMICSLACTYQMLMGMGYVPMLTGIFQHFYLYGFTGMMVFMSIFLARNFAYTSTKLERVSAEQKDTIKKLETEMEEHQRAVDLNKQQQEKLIQADKMASVGILVSGVAHEINNPNNYMLLNSNNLADVWKEMKPILDRYADEKGDFMVAGLPYSDLKDEVGGLISGISEGSERIKNIVESLKDFARQDPGTMNESVDVNSVIKSSVIILSNLMKKSTDSFKTEFSEDLPLIKGNRQQIEQVIINLISNSCQALENRNQSITVRTEFDKTRNNCVITVEDEGKGINSEEMKRIMDPFFTTKRDSGGTGLGLSISYNIIQEHKGELKFNSEPGKGTKAVIVLPAGDSM